MKKIFALSAALLLCAALAADAQWAATEALRLSKARFKFRIR